MELLCALRPGVLKATTYRDRCLQVTLLQTKTQGSDDCLYLNIFVPQGGKRRAHAPAELANAYTPLLYSNQ